MKTKLQICLALISVTLFAYLPLIIHPQKLLSRGNDLEEVFWPVYYFIRQKFWETHSLPFWNNLFFSGTPLLPDPQFSLFYPPNWIFLLPTDFAFFAWLILHSAIGGFGIYLVLTKVLKLSVFVSFVGSTLYILSPAIANFLEAGHYGLVGSYAWVPFLMLSSYYLATKPTINWIILGAFSLSGLFYTHTVIFLISVVGTAIFLLGTFIQLKGNLLKRFRVAAGLFFTTFGFIAITLLPQIDWSKSTTRFLLITNREIYPQWNGFQDFTAGIFPWVYGLSKLDTIETEKWLVLGPILIVLSFLGFLTLKKGLKYLTILLVFLILLVVLNNISPVYNLLLSLDFFVLSRVTTRVWFIIIIIVIILACISLEKILLKHKKLFYFIAFLAVFESFSIFWIKIEKPIIQDDRFAPLEVYEYLGQDPDLFRVFCTTRCLSQKQSAIYNLQLVEGYNTLSQMNYFKHMWQITGKYWNYYTLAVPPTGIYKFEKIMPDAKSLGEYNTKYIISPYEIKDKNLQWLKTVENYKIYQNLTLKPRVYGSNPTDLPPTIEYYSPNHIKVGVAPDTKSIILAEIYSSGWKAYLPGGREVPIQETPNALRLVDIPLQTKFVDFRYKPLSYQIGSKITFFSYLIMIGLLFKNKIKLTKKIFR